MECPSCSRENPERQNFCGNCGDPLVLICPGCDHANPPGQKYCGECGAGLAQPGADSPPEAHPTPQEQHPEGERRQATVVFSDLSGFTAMSERMDPEEVEGIMSRIKADAAKIVERHGGTVTQFVGDEVLALFGIPSAHENDPVQAVRAAFDMHAMVRSSGSGVEDVIGRPLQLHTGIHSGLVVTSFKDVRDGKIGVTGDTVNTAARLKGLAGEDEILVSSDTRTRIAPFFQTDKLPVPELKGKAETVTPFRVVGKSDVETRFEASQTRGLSRHVGRDRELETLRECFQTAESGQGQLVTVVGEAGLGKSRVIYEFRKELDLDRVNLVIGRCTATGENLSYFPIQDMLKRLYGITDTDGPSHMEDKVRGSALTMDAELEPHLPAIFHLLSIPSEQGFPPHMAGEVIQRRILAALRTYMLAACREKPLVMIFEDLHWADRASQEVLLRYIEAIQTQKALLVLSYRPEYQPGWGNPSHLTPLMLKPLAEDSTGEIVASTLKAGHLPTGLAAFVHAKSAGNPFFTEELALTLEEEGAIARENGRATLARELKEIRFPDTVQAIVRARMDRLPDETRNTLRLAAVVGREFTENLVARLGERRDAIPDHLQELRTLEMILEKRFHPELEFMFKHAITHQVAYESLLIQRRKALHKLVGLSIEELYADRLPEFSEMLAYHFHLGEVWDKAVEYQFKAGLKSRQNYALQPAMEYFERAGEILAKHSPEVPASLRYDLAFTSGLTLGELGRWKEAKAAFLSAEEMARGENDNPRYLQALMPRVNASRYVDPQMEEMDLLREAERLTGGDPSLLIGLKTTQLQVEWHNRNSGPYDSGGTLEKLEREVRELYQTAPPSFYKGIAALFLGAHYRFRGDGKNAAEMLGPYLPILRDGASSGIYLAVAFMYSVTLAEIGRFQEALDHLTEARRFGEEAGEITQTPRVINSLGFVHHELGMYEQALALNTEAQQYTINLSGEENPGNLETNRMTQVNLGENHLRLGRMETAREIFAEVIASAQLQQTFWARARWLPRAWMALGELELAEGRPDSAQNLVDAIVAHKWTEGNPFKKYQVRLGRLRGAIHAAGGKEKEAEAELKRTLKLAKELGFPIELWRTHRAMGDLYQMLGKKSQAATRYDSAWKIVGKIAGGLSDPELKEGFMNSPPVLELQQKVHSS